MRLRASEFDKDPYPGRPRILFVGLAQSTHTHAWVNLLATADLNVRLFALPISNGVPPDEWPVRTYVTSKVERKLPRATRASLYPRPPVGGFVNRFLLNRVYPLTMMPDAPQRWLARIIKNWQPDIIHTLGLDPAGFFYFKVRNEYQLASVGTWVHQLRGGSDLTLSRFDPALAPQIAEALRACDQVLSDNRKNFEYMTAMGLDPAQFAPIAPVPGTGGVDVDTLSQAIQTPTSSRRMILWPKTYDCPWSVALPVFEALKMVWDHIQPCEIYMLMMIPETEMWYRALPEEIKAHCHVVKNRIPRQQVFERMAQARVMLAPSLVDGTPNSMFEAMACGAFPLVSPLATITPLLEDERNTLFARNLYPHEIAAALRRAMTDDALVDAAAARNLELVRRVADRATIGPRVIAYYEQLAANRG